MIPAPQQAQWATDYEGTRTIRYAW